MHVVDFKQAISEAVTLEKFLQSTEGLWGRIFSEMSEEETLWVFAPNKYTSEGFWPAAMAIADHARLESDLILKNIITQHTPLEENGDLKNAYEEVLFFVKDRRAYRFNKDPIRVAHIYEGKEWGGERNSGKSSYHETEVRRYHPDGKDPGNVWLNEIRDQTDGETIDETLPFPREEVIRRCVRAGSIEGEIIQFWCGDNSQFKEVAKDESREFKSSNFELEFSE